ncbi:MAG TPA: caspase family protein [Polyangiaceae bacterium]|nr:caspase family protein [Polyangiaceae bacterium]
MAKGRALCVGVDEVRPASFGDDGFGAACAHEDAADMAALARSRGFATVELLTTKAGPGDRPTLASLEARLADAARELEGGDMLLLTFAGHGTVVGGAGGADEAWCLEDAVLIDDHLTAMLAEFRRDVRVWVISDSCYSGTMVDPVEAARERGGRGGPPPVRVLPGAGGGAAAEPRPILWRRRSAPAAPRRRAFGAKGGGAAIEAAVLCLGACLDKEQTPRIPPANPRLPRKTFTKAMVDLWDGGSYPESCWDFCHDALAKWVRSEALRPRPYWVGSGKAFGGQKPAFPLFPSPAGRTLARRTGLSPSPRPKGRGAHGPRAAREGARAGRAPRGGPPIGARLPAPPVRGRTNYEPHRGCFFEVRAGGPLTGVRARW